MVSTKPEALTLVTIQCPVNITMGRIYSVLISFFEDGMSNIRRIDKISDEDRAIIKASPEVACISAELDDDQIISHYVAPFVFGQHAVWMMENPNEGPDTIAIKVDIDRLRKGVQILAEKYPRHFNDIVDENDDAITADCLGQCIAYGEVIFG